MEQLGTNCWRYLPLSLSVDSSCRNVFVLLSEWDLPLVKEILVFFILPPSHLSKASFYFVCVYMNSVGGVLSKPFQEFLNRTILKYTMVINVTVIVVLGDISSTGELWNLFNLTGNYLHWWCWQLCHFLYSDSNKHNSEAQLN